MTAVVGQDGRFLGAIESGRTREESYVFHCNLCGWGKADSISPCFLKREHALTDFRSHLKHKHADILATPLPELGRRVGKEQVIR